MTSVPKLLLGIVGVLAVAGILYYVSAPRLREDSAALPPPSSPAATTSLVATSLVREPSGIEAPKKKVASAAQFPRPDLNRPVLALIPISQFAELDARKNITSLMEILTKHPDDFSAWVSLGAYRKALGDYGGAAEMWEYVAFRWSTDFVAFNNLGNLYHEELHDFQKAETNFLKAVSLRPDFTQTYVNLYNLYRYSYKGHEKQAPEVLLHGLEKNPTNLNLMLGLARHYAETSNTASSTVYYKMAIQWAETEGKAALTDSLRREAKESGVEI